MLTDHSLLVNDSGDLKGLTDSKPIAYRNAKEWKNDLAHQLRYFRFTHRTQMQAQAVETELIEDKTSEENPGQIPAAQEFFNQLPEPEDPIASDSEDEGYDFEHHMLQSPHGKPIKSWPEVLSKSKITDKLGELKAEKQFLIETRGEEEMSQSSQEDNGKKVEGKEAGKVYIVPTLQMNVIGYREDEQTFLKMLSEFVIGNSDTRMRLATGYLNLQKEFMREILKSDIDGKV